MVYPVCVSLSQTVRLILVLASKEPSYGDSTPRPNSKTLLRRAERWTRSRHSPSALPVLEVPNVETRFVISSQQLTS